MEKGSDEKTLGYKHLHYIFDPVFRINGDELYYKGSLVKWEDIESVETGSESSPNEDTITKE